MDQEKNTDAMDTTDNFDQNSDSTNIPVTDKRTAEESENVQPTSEDSNADINMKSESDVLAEDIPKHQSDEPSIPTIEKDLKDVETVSNTDGATGSVATESVVASAGGAEGGACSSLTPMQSVYHVKWITFKGIRWRVGSEQVAIITQNENGPCPLLAIMNILLLQGKVKLPGMIEMVSSGQLMEYLGDCVFENAPKNINEESRLNYEQNMSDAMAIFHKLQTGLDVNVKFTGVTDFEYTPECIVFDLLNIQLLHGWLVDPQNTQEVNAVGNCSYNQLVEKIITQKNSTTESQVTEALVAENFLNTTSHQLTYHGLSMLASQVKDAQLAVFFRNNHFSTILKHRDELLVLVTDQGFLTESNVVWETLSNVEGDCHFVDAEFRTFRKPEPSTDTVPINSQVTTGSPEQVDQDYLVALSLQQETQEAVSTSESLNNSGGLTDHELAMKLQEEEDRQMALMQQQSQQQQRRQQQAARNQQLLSEQYQQMKQEEKKKNDGCIIL